MAIDQVNISTPSNLIVFTDSTIGNAVDGIKATSARVYSIVVDNSANGGAASYLKLYNATTANVTVGVTAPDFVLLVPGGAVITVTLFTSAVQGLVFGTALSAVCVTTGGTAGSTPPVSSVLVSLSYV